jgi:hypothetical protein
MGQSINNSGDVLLPGAATNLIFHSQLGYFDLDKLVNEGAANDVAAFLAGAPESFFLNDHDSTGFGQITGRRPMPDGTRLPFILTPIAPWSSQCGFSYSQTAYTLSPPSPESQLATSTDASQATWVYPTWFSALPSSNQLNWASKNGPVPHPDSQPFPQHTNKPPFTGRAGPKRLSRHGLDHQFRGRRLYGRGQNLRGRIDR